MLSSQADDVHSLERRQVDIERPRSLSVNSCLIHVLQSFSERIHEAVVADDHGRVYHSSYAEEREWSELVYGLKYADRVDDNW